MRAKTKVNNKSRKEQRKNARIAKKARKNDYFTKLKTRNDSRKLEKKNPLSSSNQTVLKKDKNQIKRGNKKEKNVTTLSLQEEQLREIKLMNKQTQDLKKQMDKERKKQLKKEVASDDLEIKKLEKYLGLNKMKEKSKAAFFASDGLDYLLDVCDRSKLKDSGEVEKRFNEEDEDFDDDFAVVTGSSTGKKKKIKKKDKTEKNGESSSDSEPEEQLSTKASSKVGGTKVLKKKVENGSSDEYDSNDLSGSEDELDVPDSDLSDGDASSYEDSKVVNKKRKNKNEPDEVPSKKLKNNIKTVNTKKKIVEKESSDELDSNDDISGSEDEFDDLDSGLSDEDINSDESSESVTKKTEKGGSKIKSINEKNVPNKKNDKKVTTKLVKKDVEEDCSSGNDDSEIVESDVDDDQETPKKDDGMWEDIYGRMRDKQGNVVAKYQPPHLRKNADGNAGNDEKLSRLKKQLKGLLNRLAENNMVNISAQIEVLYGSNSRNDMNETLWNLYRESLLSESASPERLVAEHAMLLAVLSANIGGEVSAHCLQKCVMEWHQLWTNDADIQDKTTNNALHLLSYMFHFKLFHCTLLYDIMELLLGKLGEKEIESILLVLRTVGFSLRKEDPVRLKDFVLKAQKLANDTTGPSGSRIKFLLETILAIKNNNMSKIANYNPEYAENLKKTLRASVRKGNYNAELKISLEDLLKADVRGRWWVVGSAWTGELPGEKDGLDNDKKVMKASKAIEGFSSKLLELAKKQRMNTDTRRVVFCVLMSAEDYLDAFEKLLKLGLKGPPEREIMNVTIHCLLQEKQFNPYYEHLARRFCVCDRRFQVMLQYAAWDRIQELKSLAPTQVTNLAKFLGNLILEKNLAISVLKVVEFGELDKAAVRFIRQILLSILLAETEEAMIAVFARIAGSKPLKLFREGLRLFLHHFVLRNSKDVEGADMALLTTRVKLADSALSAADRSLAF